MNLKNYTSTVPAERSIMLIEKQLATAGAMNISKWYVDGEIAGMAFQAQINGVPASFKLPAKEDRVFKELAKQYKRWNDTAEATCKAQARRTAWKLLHDWVQIQVSMILLNQVEFMEVFLPYAFDGRQTYFEVLKEKHYKGLLIAPEEGKADRI